MLWTKIKKTLTISSGLKRKLTQQLFQHLEKIVLCREKKPFRPNKSFNKSSTTPNTNFNSDLKKKNFARKFIEQQATKEFIKKIINQQVKQT